MELLFVCVLILFTLFISMSLAYILFNKHTNLPPGKMGLPYIGESLEFINTSRKGQAEKFVFDRITKYSSQLFKTSILAQPTVVFCGAAANKFLFSNENKLVKIRIPDSAIKIFPTLEVDSLMKRKMIFNFLKPEALMRYTSMMDSIAQKHFESGWEGNQQVFVSPLVKRYAFWVACKAFLSIEDPQRVAKLAVPFNAVISGLFSFTIDFPGTTFYRAIKASNEIRVELVAIIKQRKIDLEENKASPTQDMLSQIVLATDENGQQMKQMEIARSKKPGDLLNWDDIKKMKYSWNVACEVMRLVPPFQGAFREAISDFTFSGFSIPKGWKLYWSAHSTQKNPECFQEPEKFDPTRFEGNGPAPFTFVPFGGGPRMCPGKEYARLLILVFMHNAIKRFNWEKLLPDEKIIVHPTPVPAKGLPIRLIPHLA
ncbi:hypothetical protein JRO89_XS04G0023500 [Xanthoceras sorbifolium]|uniref:Cytochrome P450 n=1 Tax=Xanthoceras sorbifolium TaxID=99658 RepID=A0ABQ8I3W6_9ROSI|nr:hypothetical protein JRO89_XS04G0023500 [Xanthoceras sorbifolium]